jgi:hypothetical protein
MQSPEIRAAMDLAGFRAVAGPQLARTAVAAGYL